MSEVVGVMVMTDSSVAGTLSAEGMSGKAVCAHQVPVACFPAIAHRCEAGPERITMPSFRRRRPYASAMFAAAFLTVAATDAAAEAVADFYAGQTITLLVGANTGGGYDTYARPVARHLGRFIPGEPGIVIKYMPAAASLSAANTLYSISARDGLII